MTKNMTGMPNGSHKTNSRPALLGPFNLGIIMVMKSRFGKIVSAALAASAIVVAATPANAAVTFNFTFLASSTAQANQAFVDAGARWSALFDDNVTINLTVGTASLGAGILAQAGSSRVSVAYTAFKSALGGDSTSGDDAIAVANLAAGSSFGLMINRTSDNPNGALSATPYLDNDGGLNNSTVRITTANAKALGIATTATSDAAITFGNAFTWDYDPSDGITAGAYDFVGIATHEIGHALGFISGVDVLDNPANSAPPGNPANAFTFVSSLDLFRFSTLSAATAGGVIDWTASTGAKYFSIDRGVTVGAGFSTGVNFGDGRQASHFKDNLGLGIMDPTAGQGELLAISSNDIKAFDVIGWNLRQAVPAVPEPSTWAMMLAGFGLVGLARRRRPVQVTATV
jgi:PEP-CTERM motif